jgi:hypothetical protein
MPWMFTLGIANAEWKTRKGTRWSIGMGYLETHCIDGMLKYFHLSKDVDEDDIAPFKFYNVLNGGVSMPVSKRLTLKMEVVVVMKGLRLLEKTPNTRISPINPYLNLIYSIGRNKRSSK